MKQKPRKKVAVKKNLNTGGVAALAESALNSGADAAVKKGLGKKLLQGLGTFDQTSGSGLAGTGDELVEQGVGMIANSIVPGSGQVVKLAMNALDFGNKVADTQINKIKNPKTRGIAEGITDIVTGNPVEGISDLINNKKNVQKSITQQQNLSADAALNARANDTYDNLNCGGKVKMKTGGKVKGPKGIDNVSANLKENSFVVPKNVANTDLAKKVFDAIKLNPNAPAALKEGGDVPVKLTAGEVIIPADKVAAADMAMKALGKTGINDLAPNAKPSNNMKDGGPVKYFKYENKWYSMDPAGSINLVEKKNGKWEPVSGAQIPFSVSQGDLKSFKEGREFTVTPLSKSNLDSRKNPPKSVGVPETGAGEPETDETKYFGNTSEESKNAFAGKKQTKTNIAAFDNIEDEDTEGTAESTQLLEDDYKFALNASLDPEWSKLAKAYAKSQTGDENNYLDYKAFSTAQLKEATRNAGLNNENILASDNATAADNATAKTPGDNNSQKKGEDEKTSPKWNAAEYASIAQAGLGATSLLMQGKMPERKVAPEIADAFHRAQLDSMYGMDEAMKDQIETGIELNRRMTNANAKEMSGGSGGTAMANMMASGNLANRAMTNLGIADADIRKDKIRYADQLAMVLAGEKEKVFNDKLNRFLKNEESYADLLQAGISNFVGARNLKDQNQTYKELNKPFQINLGGTNGTVAAASSGVL